MRRGFFGGIADKVQRANAVGAGDDSFWNGMFWSAPSATGIQINQQTALQAVAVMSCVRILAEDVSKMTPRIFERVDAGGHKLAGRREVKDHPLAKVLKRPNDWQTWPEFCRQMVVAYALRGNAYAVILRDWRGNPVTFVPINPDRVALWQATDGSLFWMVTRAGLHELAVLASQPLLIPYDDVFHLKDLSADGLIGTSPIALAREAIGLTLAQEQQYARLMGNGARPGGILTTDQKLSKEAAERIRDDWNKVNQGLVNTGRTAVLEAGLKWQALQINSADLQFLQMRQFQLNEICRIFRVPPHMVGDLSRGTFNNIVQQSQEYRNNTLTSHSDVWEKRFDFQFELEADNLLIDFDETALLKADLTARYNAYRVGILTGFIRRNEARIAEGLDPDEDAEALLEPVNMIDAGSDHMGGDNPGAGKPTEKVTVSDQPEDSAPGV